VLGVTLIDDYGHHPAEIRATIEAARRAFPGEEEHRIVVAFQPHRYTRTRDLFDEFTRAFNQADVLLVTDIYPAGEPPIPGVSADRLVQAIREHGHHDATYVPDKAELPDALEAIVRPGDVVIALGAGDVNASVRALKVRLEAREASMGAEVAS
jgi:UDP-N-acetylmuramate--alanine ligase